MNLSPQQIKINSDKKLILADDTGTIVDVTNEAAESLGYSPSDLLNIQFKNVINPVDDNSAGSNCQEILETCEVEKTKQLKTGQNDIFTVTFDVYSVTVDDLVYSYFEIKEIVSSKNQNEPSTKELIERSELNKTKPNEMDEILKNVRIESPAGEMTLEEIMFDLLVAQNEIEQYKNGALTMHKMLDERLQEEEKINGNAETCRILQEIKQDALTLYERIDA